MKNLLLFITLSLFYSCGNPYDDESQAMMDSSFRYINDFDVIYQYETNIKTGSALVNCDSVKTLYDSVKNQSPESGLKFARNFLDYVKEMGRNTKYLSDSIKIINRRINDSLQEVDYRNWLKTPAGKLKKQHPDWDQRMCNQEYDRIQKESNWNQSKAGKIQKKHPEWSKEDCIRLANREIWIGMHYEMVVYLRGDYDDLNTSNYGNGNQYQMCWWDYNPSCFYCDSYGIVTSYN